MSGGHLLCADRSGAETDSPWSPHGWVCLAARAADCKSVTLKTPQVRVLPHPLSVCVSEWFMVPPLKESVRQRTEGSNPSANDSEPG